MCPLGGVSQCQGHILNQLFKVGISPASLLSSTKHIHRRPWHLTRALLCCSNYQSLVPSIIIMGKLVINTNSSVTKTNKIRNSRWGAQKFSSWSWSILKFESYCNPTTTWVTSMFTSVTHQARWPLCSLIFSILMTLPSISATHSLVSVLSNSKFIHVYRLKTSYICITISLPLYSLCFPWMVTNSLMSSGRHHLCSGESKIFLPNRSPKLLIYTFKAKSKLHLDISLVSHSNMSKN